MPRQPRALVVFVAQPGGVALKNRINFAICQAPEMRVILPRLDPNAKKAKGT